MFRKFTLGLPALMLITVSLTGCGTSRYMTNRAADFQDIFQIAGGVTAENPYTGMIPPSLGIHVQASEFLNLGAIHFSGLLSEQDGRGHFAGFESRTRFGLGPWQQIKIDQDYAGGRENYFKKMGTLWSDRMHSPDLRFMNRPAKNLHYQTLLSPEEGCPILHRGWQYWENISLELAISEPFITHFGFHTRLGLDISEVSDALLGWFGLDFKHDDLTLAEYEEMVGSTRARRGTSWAPKPASDADVVIIEEKVMAPAASTVAPPPPVAESAPVTIPEAPAVIETTPAQP